MKDSAALAVDVLKQVARLIDKLTVEQLTALATGDAQIAFVSPDITIPASTRRPASPRSARTPKLSVTEVADRLPELADRDEAIKYLNGSKLVIGDLKAVAEKLGKPPRGKRKDDIIRNLAEDVIGFRTRHETSLGGPYRR